MKITDVDYIKDYELLLTFSDGQKKKVDLQPYLTGEVFGELLDLDKFIQIPSSFLRPYSSDIISQIISFVKSKKQKNRFFMGNSKQGELFRLALQDARN